MSERPTYKDLYEAMKRIADRLEQETKFALAYALAEKFFDPHHMCGIDDIALTEQFVMAAVEKRMAGLKSLTKSVYTGRLVDRQLKRTEAALAEYDTKAKRLGVTL